MAPPGAVLLLLLATAAAAGRYRRLHPVSLHGPAVKTFSAASAVSCGLRCEAHTPQQCSGFIYAPDDSTCRLFSGDCRGPAVNSSQQTTERYMARSVPSEPAVGRCGCPAGFHRCAGRCLRQLDLAVNHTTAESQCAALGAHLAVPRSDEENQCAAAAAATAGTRAVWTGLIELPAMEGVYTGADGCGAVPVQGRWASLQPDDGGPGVAEDRVLIMSTGTVHAAGWHDNPAGARWQPLCQLALGYRPGCP
ncbi:hypothetical protein FJT64_023996 [Amphibalanus amphitrite]|uniref:C-type lectin domain-containing protein n=1 Tax=Amphibalanus amphitrite TaxID=1232801 RepID=A0A6A4WJX2_AMPAM|nr:hypothetical protein FJT64_023996 [Amphibalanus amphitrite]